MIKDSFLGTFMNKYLIFLFKTTVLLSLGHSPLSAMIVPFEGRSWNRFA